ncbi:MAG: hypothetical protein ABMA13_08060 [Chthoniobacteraceae bacterium]
MNPPAGAVPDRSTSGHAPGLGRALLNCAVFLAALAGLCAAIRIAQPFPKVLGVYQKWLYFQKHKDRYDAIFLGSSRFYHQIIPAQFDERVKAATGREFRTFNFGYDAMWPPESFWMLRQLLAMKPARLRWVFIDCMDISPHLDERNMHTRRIAYWHDIRHTRMAMDAVAELRMRPILKWSLWSAHATYLLRQWTSQGLGTEWLAFELGLEKRKKPSRWDPPDAWRDTEGYEPEKLARFTGPQLEKFERDVVAWRKGVPPVPIKPSLRNALAEITTEARAAKIEPILVLTPTVTPQENFSGLPEGVAVWRYDDADRYAALYDPAHHYDAAHLNHEGAQIFTDLLAERFAALLKQ